MPDNEELSSLEQVRRRLYDAGATPTFEEPHLAERPVERAKGWDQLKTMQEEAHQMSGPARFFIVAFLFFLVTAGGAILYLVFGGRAVSTHNVDLTTQGPTTISSGDTVPLLIKLENRNPVAMRGAVLSVDFPDGTKATDDPTKPFTAYTEELGDIASGAKIERTVRASVFGSEGQRVTLPVRVEYRTDSSNSVFVKNKQYDFTITSSPISLNVSHVTQISSGQTVTVTVTVKSNASTVLDNVAIAAEYPFGFVPSTATPPPASGTLFSLGRFNPGEEKKITIVGVLSGENNDERVFKFNAGQLSSPNAPALTTAFSTKEAVIRLTKPFIATTLAVNRDTSDSPVVQVGSPVQVVLTWTNTLPTPVTNARITVALSGEALNANAVSGGSGFYRSSDTTVLFESATNPSLANLQPGDTGQGTFTFTPKSSSARNPSVTLKVSVAGQRLSETNVPETITSTLTRTVKVGTNLGLTGRILHTTGPFANAGAWPPEANKETTYTVVYSLSNSGNSVAGAKVSATLPSYVRYTGGTSPNDGSITYNDTTRTVTWNAGDVASGGAAKSAAFQIAFTPSVSQVGTSPVLVNAQQVTAVDRFTQRDIVGSVPALTTQLTTDPGYSAEDGIVK